MESESSRDSGGGACCGSDVHVWSIAPVGRLATGQRSASRLPPLGKAMRHAYLVSDLYVVVSRDTTVSPKAHSNSSSTGAGSSGGM